MNTETERSTKIAALNDKLRKTLQGGQILMTRGVQATGQVTAIMTKVRTFADFGPDNDPYGEHDFGVVKHDGESVYWKVDYYDQRLEGGEDPLSPHCRRVLTVMLAIEY
jgi:hypothetical protein